MGAGYGEFTRQAGNRQSRPGRLPQHDRQQDAEPSLTLGELGQFGDPVQHPLSGTVGVHNNAFRVVNGNVTFASFQPYNSHESFAIDSSSTNGLFGVATGPGTFSDLTFAGVPEPASLALLGAGRLGIAMCSRSATRRTIRLPKCPG